MINHPVFILYLLLKNMCYKLIFNILTLHEILVRSILQIYLLTCVNCNRNLATLTCTRGDNIKYILIIKSLYLHYEPTVDFYHLQMVKDYSFLKKYVILLII